MIEYTVFCEEQGRPYPHYWELCIGSCHAATVLREDVRNHIRNAHRDCGFRYLRFHGLFDDDMSVVIKPMFGGEEIISFYNIDSIFDFLLDTGMKPFVELGFMPEALASGSQTCMHYKGNVTLPADYGKWNRFIRLFGEHLIARYGKEEIAQWFFEVWNEPNLSFFFDGTQEDYFELYENTVRTLKAVDGCFRVGGPATSVNSWIPEFRSFCEKNQVPLDFITTHHYPSDDPLSSMGMNGPGKKGNVMTPEVAEMMKSMTPEEIQNMINKMIGGGAKNPRDVLKRMTEKAKREAGEYPLYYTEWNGSKEYDTSYQAAFIIQTLGSNENLVEGYSFWTVSDIFEESGMKPGPFKNEFGIQTNHGIPKPSYRIFQALHEAGNSRLPVEGGHRTAEVMALREGKTVTVFVYNHDIERREIRPEEMRIHLNGRIASIAKAVIDETHCNPLKVWTDMGSPEYLDRKQVSALEEASRLVYEPVEKTDEAVQTVDFTSEPESVVILKIELES